MEHDETKYVMGQRITYSNVMNATRQARKSAFDAKESYQRMVAEGRSEHNKDLEEMLHTTWSIISHVYDFLPWSEYGNY